MHTILTNPDNKPFYGFGLGLRPEYYQTLLARGLPGEVLPDKTQNPDWLEIISENYMVDGGKPLYFLDQFKERYPIAMHGVSMNIGSVDPLDRLYLEQLKTLANKVNPIWVSDHCCWTGANAHNAHDLLPLPYNEESINHIAQRITQAQDILERPILLENLSSYLSFKDSTMTEWEFLSAICEQADCYLLLDINNIYVSAVNHDFDPYEYLAAIPANKVKEIHLAGYEKMDNYLFDTHGYQVHAPVWELYRAALKKFGAVPTLIEWDTDIPDFTTLRNEAAKAEQLMKDVV